MTYKEWLEDYILRREKIVKKLSHLSDDELVDYFDYDSLIVNEPDFCPLFAKKQKCHEIEDLNCYLCGCPNFRFDDNGFKKKNGKMIFSCCAIKSPNAKEIETENGYHLDCSKCVIPHKKSYIKKVFSRSWKKIMKKVII